MQYLGAISKNDKMILIHFQGKPFNNTVIQVYAPANNAKENKMKTQERMSFSLGGIRMQK